jgi:hypothetical protein
MADFSDLVLIIFSLGAGWFLRFFWVKRGETLIHQRDKFRLIDELKQLKQNMAESTCAAGQP